MTYGYRDVKIELSPDQFENLHKECTAEFMTMTDVIKKRLFGSDVVTNGHSLWYTSEDAGLIYVDSFKSLNEIYDYIVNQSKDRKWLGANDLNARYNVHLGNSEFTTPTHVIWALNFNNIDTAELVELVGQCTTYAHKKQGTTNSVVKYMQYDQGGLFIVELSSYLEELVNY